MLSFISVIIPCSLHDQTFFLGAKKISKNNERSAISYDANSNAN